jgi:nucleoside-diphosphate-sugar epimerase
VIAACRAHRIERLVYTSTPSVVSAGGDLEGVDESVPYPAHFEAEYPRTKALAERLVLEANGPELRTVALRPHLVWGPGDTQLVARIVARARAGKLRLVGDGKALIDVVYVDNAAEAHLLAADRLEPGSPVAGKAYFISQGEPIPVGAMINAILAAAGLPAETRTVPPRVAWFAGWMLEGLHRVFRPGVEPRMTRFLARQLSTPHWFDISAARRDLGYSPRVSTEEGLRRLAKSLRDA